MSAEVRWQRLAALTGLWLFLVVATLAGRPALPVDETRVLSVAWEMWSRQDFLVPHLNGAPYSHKPPLLPWLIVLGWKVTGVNDIWPRLVSPLFALGILWLTRLLAERLWPQQREAAELAPWLLLGTLFWAALSTAALYDMPLSFFALAGVLGLVHAWQRGGVGGFAVFGIAIGLGILSKGPVILLHLGIPAVLAPLWVGNRRPGWTRWYLAVAGGTAFGLALAGSWAIPAALSGGETYAGAILWSQTTGRVVSAFAHKRPFWWYLPLLPLLLLPWIAWPALWRALRALPGGPLDPGTRLMLLWAGGGLLAFSAISGKQVHYLLPLLPALALIAARAACALPSANPRDGWLPGLVTLLLGALLAGLAYAGPRFGLPHWSAPALLAAGVVVAGAGVAVMLVRCASVRGEAVKLAVASALAIAALEAGLAPPFWSAYDLRPASAWLKGLEARGVPVAHVGTYHGQFQFPGRLTRPLEPVSPGELAAWFARHPEGRAVVYARPGNPALDRAEFTHAYGRLTLAIVDRRVDATRLGAE